MIFHNFAQFFIILAIFHHFSHFFIFHHFSYFFCNFHHFQTNSARSMTKRGSSVYWEVARLLKYQKTQPPMRMVPLRQKMPTLLHCTKCLIQVVHWRLTQFHLNQFAKTCLRARWEHLPTIKVGSVFLNQTFWSFTRFLRLSVAKFDDFLQNYLLFWIFCGFYGLQWPNSIIFCKITDCIR